MVQSVEILWNNCLKVIQDNVPENAFRTWFTPIKPLSYENNVLTIQVPSQFFFEYLEDKYVDLLRMTLFREIGNNTVLNYRVLVENTTNTMVNYQGEIKSFGVDRIIPKDANKAPSPFRKSVPQNFDSQLNPKYTFDNFFEGESNKLARTAGLSVAQNPGKQRSIRFSSTGIPGWEKLIFAMLSALLSRNYILKRGCCIFPRTCSRCSLLMPDASIQSTISSISTKASMS